MYPLIRFAMAVWRTRRKDVIGPFDTHADRLTCLPWDIDPWRELNNGRALTLYDLPRSNHALRTGLWEVLQREGWGYAVAGVSVRYRQRVRMFQRLTVTARLIGWDDRFMYLEQGMWRGDTCTSQMLLRAAITGPDGIVPTARVAAAWGMDGSPPLPEWVTDWCAAEAKRPWPPATP
jgi:acyl-CoA thioesterase FadM